MCRLALSVFLLLALILPLAPAAGADSTPEQNKAIVRKVYDEVINAGKFDSIHKYVTADAVDHQIAPGKTAPGTIRENLKEFISVFRKAFPDMKVTVDDVIAEGDKVVARCTLTGTNKGEFMGMPATGKTISIQMIDILRFKDGMCVEHWGVSDDAGMMAQLGDPEKK